MHLQLFWPLFGSFGPTFFGYLNLAFIGSGSKPKEDNYSADSKNVNSTENLSDLTEGDKAADSLKSAKDKNIHSLSYFRLRWRYIEANLRCF